MTRIAIEDLAFRYPGAPSDTLSSLQLEICSGEAHALLGASGAGKTTLLNLLSGLLRPSSGRILFDGKDVSNLAPKLRNIAQVFQFPVLYDAMNVANNLAFPLRNFGFAPSDIESRVACIADELDLRSALDRKVSGLSLFEKQLVSVGKALIRPNVDVVLLDEPLTAVEPHRKWQLRQSLKRVQVDLGVTMIYVTHDQTEALTFADRVSVLTVDGILQTATPEAIYAEPSFEAVGSFVGSPGMDFVNVAGLSRVPSNLDASQKLGLRPEWVELCVPGDGMTAGVCDDIVVLGTAFGERVGIATVTTPAGTINVRTSGDVALGTRLGIRFKRAAVYRDTALVGSHEF